MEGPVEIIKRLMRDENVTNIQVTKYDDRGPRIEVSYVAIYDLADRDVQENIGDDARISGSAFKKMLYSDIPEPEKPMRLTRWFGKALNQADRELLAQDGAKAVSWKTMSPRELFQKMAQHYHELDVAIAQNKNWFGTIEAIDVVNYALMIATRCTAISDGSEEWK